MGGFKMNKLKEKEKSCKERVLEHWKNRESDLHVFMDSPDQETEELGSINDYGLCIDVVEPGTFENRERYLRYQLSWGGPSDEIRFYENGEIEYWFLDWFDGAGIDISDNDVALWIRDFLTEYGFDFTVCQ